MTGYNFTERTRIVLIGARRIAQGLGHDSVECLHLLLAILREASPALELALAARGYDSRQLLENLENRVLPCGEPVLDDDLPYEDEAKDALQLGLLAASQLGHSTTGPEHILIGIASLPESQAGRFLHEKSLTADQLRSGLAVTLAF
jgi:ATP-dependent Clp protease ATP-binding subunit ClpC